MSIKSFVKSFSIYGLIPIFLTKSLSSIREDIIRKLRDGKIIEDPVDNNVHHNHTP